MVFLTDLLAIMPLWLIFLVIALILLYIYGTQPYRIWNELGVRGPCPSPFIGNMSEIFDDRIGTRAALKKWQSQYGRIFGVYFFRDPALVVTDPEALKMIFVKDFNNYADRYMVGRGTLQQRIIKKGVFFDDGADWKRKRRIMTPTFSSGKLRMLTHYINLTAQRLGESLQKSANAGETVEAKQVFGAFTMDVICGTAFGLDTNSLQDYEGPFIQHAKSMMTFEKLLQLRMALAGMFPIVGKIFETLKIGFFKYRDVKFFEDNIMNLIKERKAQSTAQKHTDFLQLLMNAEDDSTDGSIGEKKLSAEEIAAQGVIFVIAGYETTATTLQYLTYELAKHPDIQRKIVQEINDVLGNDTIPDYDNCQRLPFLEAVINETLRMYPPVHLLSRQVEKDTVLCGFSLPAEAAIMIPVSVIGRDPEFFPDPDEFSPERFLESNKQDINPVLFLPFGFGPRSCIGLRLAMMELKIALVHVLRHVWITDATPDVLDIEDYTGVLVPRKPIRLQLKAVQVK